MAFLGIVFKQILMVISLALLGSFLILLSIAYLLNIVENPINIFERYQFYGSIQYQ